MRQVIFIFLLCTALLVLVSFNPAYAEQPQQDEPTVTECLLVSTSGNLNVYRCEDYDRGLYFYMNSYGFMLGDTN